jgi:N-acetylglucosamine-6-phosphate deacetylase
MTVVAAARVVTGEVVHAPGWVQYERGRIVAVGPGRPGRVDRDLGPAVVVPGFVDLHVHGGGGGSFTDGDPESARRAVEAHRRHGTTTTMASLVTAAPDDLLRSVALLRELRQDGLIAGIHLEGPWISPYRCGAHEPGQLRDPDPAEIARLLTAGGGDIAMVTLAPELPGGPDAIRQVVDAGALAAVGHTDASYEQTVAAVGAGARLGTHLFNAMRPVHHREPGPIVALLEDPRVSVELVADGTHLHPALYRQVSGTAGPDRVVLVTDAMAAAGASDGDYRLGAMHVSVRHGTALIAGTNTIAGSTATMDELFRRAACGGDGPSPAGSGADGAADAALLQAVRQTSVNPARLLGRPDVGGLRPQMRADIVVLAPDLTVTEVIARGATVSTA